MNLQIQLLSSTERTLSASQPINAHAGNSSPQLPDAESLRLYSLKI